MLCPCWPFVIEQVMEQVPRMPRMEKQPRREWRMDRQRSLPRRLQSGSHDWQRSLPACLPALAAYGLAA